MSSFKNCAQLSEAVSKFWNIPLRKGSIVTNSSGFRCLSWGFKQRNRQEKSETVSTCAKMGICTVTATYPSSLLNSLASLAASYDVLRMLVQSLALAHLSIIARTMQKWPRRGPFPFMMPMKNEYEDPSWNGNSSKLAVYISPRMSGADNWVTLSLAKHILTYYGIIVHWLVKIL